MKHLISLLWLLIIISCQKKSSQEVGAGSDTVDLHKTEIANTVPSPEFKSYLSNFKSTALPLVALNPDSLAIPAKPNDESFFKSIRGDRAFFSWWPYRIISTNDKYIAVLTIELNNINNYVAVLETYAPDGNRIDAKVLDFGFEEYGNPSGSIEIRNDLSIYVYATSTIAEYDENENEIPGSQKRKLFFMEGKLLDDGKIQLSGVSDKILE